MGKKISKSQNMPKRSSAQPKKNENKKPYKLTSMIATPLIILVIIAFGISRMSNHINTNTSNSSTTKQVYDNTMQKITPTVTPQLASNGKEDEYAFRYQMQQPKKGDTVALMKTSKGDIQIKFFPAEAPKAVENFTRLAQEGYYNGLTFHRVMNDFMIQGGDPKGDGTGGESIWKKPFEDEFSNKLHNFRGALSMANSRENTNGSQFFIVQKKNMNDGSIPKAQISKKLAALYTIQGGTPLLDGKHTVFGQVFEGLDIVDSIASVKTGTNNKPVEDVKIEKVEISKY